MLYPAWLTESARAGEMRAEIGAMRLDDDGRLAVRPAELAGRRRELAARGLG